MVFVFLILTYFTSMIMSSCIHVAANGIASFVFMAVLSTLFCVKTPIFDFSV